jgi:hypothetical protein
MVQITGVRFFCRCTDLPGGVVDVPPQGPFVWRRRGAVGRGDRMFRGWGRRWSMRDVGRGSEKIFGWRVASSATVFAGWNWEWGGVDAEWAHGLG